MLENRTWFSITLVTIAAAVSCGGKGINGELAAAGVAGLVDEGLAGAADDTGGAAEGGAAHGGALGGGP